jgi:DNA-directed RNA polymerase subunit RPC12/RpoP
MSRSDYYRPAEWQIRKIYRCTSCRSENEYMADQHVEGGRCPCGGTLTYAGETYPADSNYWEEQRDPDGEWRSRRY